MHHLLQLVSSFAFPSKPRLFRARFSTVTEFITFGVQYGTEEVQYGQDYPRGEEIFRLAIKVTKALAKQAGLDFQASSLIIARDLETGLHIDAKNPRGMTNLQFTLGSYRSPSFVSSRQGRLFVALPKAGWRRCDVHKNWVCVDASLAAPQALQAASNAAPLRFVERSVNGSRWTDAAGLEFHFPRDTEAVAIMPQSWKHAADRSAGYVAGDFVPGVWLDSKEKLIEFYAVDTPHATEDFFTGDAQTDHRFNFTWYNQASFPNADDETHTRHILKLQQFGLVLPALDCFVPRVSAAKQKDLQQLV